MNNTEKRKKNETHEKTNVNLTRAAEGEENKNEEEVLKDKG